MTDIRDDLIRIGTDNTGRRHWYYTPEEQILVYEDEQIQPIKTVELEPQSGKTVDLWVQWIRDEKMGWQPGRGYYAADEETEMFAKEIARAALGKDPITRPSSSP